MLVRLRFGDECNFEDTKLKRLPDELLVKLRYEALHRRLLAATALTYDDTLSIYLDFESSKTQTKLSHSKLCSRPETFSIYKNSVEHNAHKLKITNGNYKY